MTPVSPPPLLFLGEIDEVSGAGATEHVVWLVVGPVSERYDSVVAAPFSRA